MSARRQRILPRLIEEEMRDSFLDYSMSVIVQRALPDIRDGLKPVHRRILYAMEGLGLQPERPYKKSATVVGEVLGKYHPHGDSPVYDAMVRMVQEFSLRYPLIDGQGNFGSIDGDPAAAYRYTEARLARTATELLGDLDKETVDFVPNFDSRLQEPTVLPARLPNFILNGSSGIAVGMSTNVPPHNLVEIAEAIRMICGDDPVSVDDLLDVVPGPDFPTGGFILGLEGIRNLYETGRGRIVMRARVIRESMRGGKSQLVVTELPYTVSKVRVINQIADLARKGNLDDVSDLRDESDREGMRIVIELKRRADPVKVLQTIYKKTALQTTFGAIMLALDNGQPREFNLQEVLERYRDHRVDVIQRRSRFQLEKAEAERHVTEGLIAALDQIDRVIKIIRGSKDRAEASAELQEDLGLSEAQAEAILNMRLARLTRLERDMLVKRLEELEATIAELRAILASEARQLEVMLAELDQLVERYGDPRRTEIVTDEPSTATTVEASDLDEDVVVTVSHQGYVKRIPMHIHKRRMRSGKALAGMERYDDDYLERIIVARSSGWLLAFTEGGHTYFLPVEDVPEGGRSSRGQSMAGILGADRRDRIVSVISVEDLNVERPLVFLTRKGIIKRTLLSEFSHPRAGGIIGAGVKKGDEILDVVLSDGESELLLVTSHGRGIRFSETQVPLVGRTAQGVKGVDLRDPEDEAIAVVVLRRDATVFTMTDDGYGKRSEVDEFPSQNRGGMGTMALPGDVPNILVAALETVDGDHLVIHTGSGAAYTLAAEEVPVMNRRALGEPLVQVAQGDQVVEVTRGEGSGGTPAAAEKAGKGQLDLLGG